MTSGTKTNSRYHPGYPPDGRISLGLPTKSQPVTGRPGLITNRKAFTRPTQEPDRQTLSHRLTPTAGSLELSGKDKFSFKVFYMYFIKLNHKPARMSICRNVQKSKRNRKVFWREKHLTFSGGHDIVLAILKKALTKTVRLRKCPENRWLVRTGDFPSKDPSLLSRRAERQQ